MSPYIKQNVNIPITQNNDSVSKLPSDNMAMWSRFTLINWRRIGDNPLSEQMLTPFTDEYMRH